METSQPTEVVSSENPQPAEEMQTSEAEPEANTNAESQNVPTAAARPLQVHQRKTKQQVAQQIPMKIVHPRLKRQRRRAPRKRKH